MTDEARALAQQEVAFCEQVLAKGGASVLSETLKGVDEPESWTKYPAGEVFDPATGAHWFYHSHSTIPHEHGHFHMFLRPNGKDGPIHHLIAIGVDGHGRPLRLFTVNQWVVDDDWLDAQSTVALVEKFDVHMPQPNYLVNRWLTAMVVAHGDVVAGLILERDNSLQTYASSIAGDVRSDRSLEVTSQVSLR
ncbi:MAG: hypothetical protein AB8B88_13670 [Devosiaceae bacterium]